MQSILDTAERTAADRLIALALTEDLNTVGDLTSQAVIPKDQRAQVEIVARQAGILAGVPVAQLVFAKLDASVNWISTLEDGAALAANDLIATASGPLQSLLTGERIVLNFLSHLSGVATLTQKFVAQVAGSNVKIFDTRKTLPGWRLLQKYAVRAGGGTNHRLGLYDGVLIKDNHLAAWSAGSPSRSIADAVRQARRSAPDSASIEVEVDDLEQLQDALHAPPDSVLLDNMDAATMRKAVSIRDKMAPHVLLEASGGIALDSVTEIARAGIDRISIGALTHSATAVDIAFDWHLDEEAIVRD